MSNLYDIKNVAKGKFHGDLHLQLRTEDGSIQTVSLGPGKTRENVLEEELTDQVRSMARQVRHRPPVLELKLQESEPAQEEPKAETASEEAPRESRKRKKSSEDDAPPAAEGQNP